jgi:hypothetical protein
VTRADRRCLLQRLAFSKLHHFSWDNFPANTMAYDNHGEDPAGNRDAGEEERGEGRGGRQQEVVLLVLDGSRFCVSRTKNGKEKCECKSKWRGRREVGV